MNTHITYYNTLTNNVSYVVLPYSLDKSFVNSLTNKDIYKLLRRLGYENVHPLNKLSIKIV